ncbi:MAG TPA: HlyD family efflux transporter periplasmic adaptor subunit [Candidatus Avilachnospira avistercoris]|nr:HlyD family efflux transporter periplasmic adaptor subunit [Candidatus Avilachnospira avistercoris]
MDEQESRGLNEPKEAKELPKKQKKNKRQKQRFKKRIIIIALLLIAAIIGVRVFVSKKQAEEAAKAAVSPSNTGTVMRGSIQDELTSSGSLEAGDTYTITSLVEGEIIEADFEEGDQVTEGQVLYRIEASDAQRQLNTAERDYNITKENYDKYLPQYEGGIYRATEAGYVTDITMKKGDTVGGQGGTAIATLYNDTAMELRLPFLSIEADQIPIGADVIVTLNDTVESIPGRVTDKSNLEETLTGGTMIKYVTIVVSNPGGLTESDRATAQYGDIYSAGDGAFSAYQSDSLRCELPVGVEIAEVLVSEGQYVSNGTPLFRMTDDSYQDAVNQLEDELTAAQDNYDKMQDDLAEYTITAPISGQVISKNAKTGDNISRSSGTSATELATIYDLSELTFEMSIDELDISDVEVGLEVEVTADAFPGVTYMGHVSNVSLNGSYQSGVTTYPVVVTLDDMEGLLPGMNVDGTIILSEAEDVLYIPSGGLQRGDVVYVKDDSMPASMPDMSAISERALAEVPEGFTAVKVETGLVTDDYVEIVSGLSEGQEIYVSETESSSMGMFGGMTMTFTGGPGGGGPGGGGPGGGGMRR